MRSVAACSVCLLLILMSVGPSFGQASGWTKFSSPEGNFSVLLPVVPGFKTLVNEPSGTGPTRKVGSTVSMYTSRSGYEFYMIGWVDYEPGFSFNDQAEIRANRDNFIKGLGAELVSEKPVAYGRWPGIEVLVKKDSREYLSRIYILRSRPYMLIASGASKANSESFFNSFRFPER